MAGTPKKADTLVSTLWGTDHIAPRVGFGHASLSLAPSLRSSLAKCPDPASPVLISFAHGSGFLILGAKCAGTSLPLTHSKNPAYTGFFSFAPRVRLEP